VRFSRTLSALETIALLVPGLSLRSNPGLKLANAFGVVGRLLTGGLHLRTAAFVCDQRPISLPDLRSSPADLQPEFECRGSKAGS
jgi:hypothetical protein